ncbi:GAF domain-containing SpoIIE family protein phosphatase [Symbioplanes lichenis]|uniref:GAF domain-containing SpoIIE family protein phosphatase n=1 Tax=Symbioplanes lichenis TaxID=1629072 RepID=UPI00273989C3|nr:SpoIIE family protein phosphatase [Actinoplanes lichenis]
MLGWGDAATARLEALRRTGLDAVADEMFDRFADMVRTVLKVPVALVSLVTDERQIFPGACGLGEPWQQARETPLSHSFCQHVVATEEPLIIVDARADERVRGNLAIEDLGVIGYAGMPLTDADGLVLGSLCAIDHEPREWTGAELALLADLAAACSDSLRARITAGRAARQEARAHAAFERTRLLLRASTVLAGADTLDKVIDAVRDLVTGALDPAYVGVSLLDDQARVAGHSLRLLPPAVADRWALYPADARTPSALAARSGRPVLLPDLAAVAAATPEALATFEEMGWQSVAAVPLTGPDGPVGALAFAWKAPNTLDEDEIGIVTALAGFVLLAITRSRLLDDRRTAAAVMQKALLSPLPQHDHLRLAARYAPARHEDHVGGDWYDAISLDQRLVLIIGDVTGHSITAAATMSQYRSMLRTLVIDRHEPPSAVLRRLEHTSRTAGVAALATVLLAYLDPAPGGGHTLTWANAGHPTPLALLPDGTVTALGGHDPLIGAARRVSRRNQVCGLPPGAVLVLHTDGLVESRSATYDEGLAAVHDLLGRHRAAGADKLADVLLDHAAVAAREDDVALLVVSTPG